MSLNKEMIFGLLGGDNMKMLVIDSYALKSYDVSRSNPSFVTSTPIRLTSVTGMLRYGILTIKYPDNSSFTIEGNGDNFAPDIYLPEGTTITVASSGARLFYLSCKWIDV